MSPVIDSTELPALRRRTRCILVSRDPNTLWAYWDHTPSDRQQRTSRLQSQSKNIRFLLRVYDVTQVKFNGANANHVWDMEVGPGAKSAYINVWQDNADYCVEYGLTTGKKHFMALARSNIVRAPSRTPSKRDDLIWQDIKFPKKSPAYIQEDLKKDIKSHYHGLIQQQSKGSFTSEGQAHVERLIKEKYSPQGEGLQAKSGRRPRVYHLTAQDIRTYYLRFFHRKSRHPRGLRSLVAGIPIGISWQKVRPLISTVELIKHLHPAGASEKQAPGASENFGGVQGSEGRLKQRKFFFEIWTELIVHGRTEPDAAVWLNQKGVKLNPDGTFTLHYALPDGEIPLKFVAQSADGVEQRHIYTRVERENTVYFPKILKAYE
ncbi:MAG: DUF4912 domain-containing protein [Candidatus Omnitrophica bacterium]|nr:DUF4912 domain-containing protein [Candidatus Omnitrophota bacterium]MDE2221524.1 DUF4912 domain-containing protein [Candidatus Omnitrophota bacterium]